MASVQLISNRWFVPVDTNSVVLWVNEEGRLEYALYEHFEGKQPCANPRTLGGGWFDAIEAAIALADQNGRPTVFQIQF
jgi:hypothetical protein